MHRRRFLALPAALVPAALLPAGARALSFEEASPALLADLAASCGAGDQAHARLLALLEAGAPLAEDQRQVLAGCPFCRCRLALAPSDRAD